MCLSVTGCKSKRCIVPLLACIGFLISFGFRSNLSIALKLMTEKWDGESPEFDWSSRTISVINSHYSWGYLVTQIPGGIFASRGRANAIFGAGIALSAVMNLLIPQCAKFSVGHLIFLLFVQGLAEGVTLPACYALMRLWAPPFERTRFATIVLIGVYTSGVIGLPLTSLVSYHCGWSSPFYIYGVAGILWYFLWTWMISEKPSKHKSITADELLYLEQSLGPSEESVSFKTIPWKRMLRSLPLWAIGIASFCQSWSLTLLIDYLPKYFRNRFHLDVQEVGLLQIIPRFLMALALLLGGILADCLIRRSYSVTKIRKIFTSCGFSAGVLSLIVVAYAIHNVLLTFVSMALATAVSGFAIAGFNVNHLDIAPRYAGILMGISNSFGIISGLISPYAVEVFQWEHVFILAAAIQLIGLIFYAIFASGEIQPWGEPGLRVCEDVQMEAQALANEPDSHECI